MLDLPNLILAPAQSLELRIIHDPVGLDDQLALGLDHCSAVRVELLPTLESSIANANLQAGAIREGQWVIGSGGA